MHTLVFYGRLSAQFGHYKKNTIVNTKSWTCSTSFNTWEFIDGTWTVFLSFKYVSSFNKLFIVWLHRMLGQHSPQRHTKRRNWRGKSAETHSVPHFFSLIWSWQNAWHFAARVTAVIFNHQWETAEETTPKPFCKAGSVLYLELRDSLSQWQCWNRNRHRPRSRNPELLQPAGTEFEILEAPEITSQVYFLTPKYLFPNCTIAYNCPIPIVYHHSGRNVPMAAWVTQCPSILLESTGYVGCLPMSCGFKFVGFRWDSYAFFFLLSWSIWWLV